MICSTDSSSYDLRRLKMDKYKTLALSDRTAGVRGAGPGRLKVMNKTKYYYSGNLVATPVCEKYLLL